MQGRADRQGSANRPSAADEGDDMGEEVVAGGDGGALAADEEDPGALSGMIGSDADGQEEQEAQDEVGLLGELWAVINKQANWGPLGLFGDQFQLFGGRRLWKLVGLDLGSTVGSKSEMFNTVSNWMGLERLLDIQDDSAVQQLMSDVRCLVSRCHLRGSDLSRLMCWDPKLRSLDVVMSHELCNIDRHGNITPYKSVGGTETWKAIKALICDLNLSYDHLSIICGAYKQSKLPSVEELHRRGVDQTFAMPICLDGESKMSRLEDNLTSGWRFKTIRTPGTSAPGGVDHYG